ncbi:hypothetical protein GT020_10530 [Glutamicibacter soli]|uniref:Uncharacterized protein n=1 Tax=Glutamicibacter soli TaxID=453836 RepID=A0A6L9GAX6_9MICC|nr:hypothetical protein [Glutamicibacter soli]NAZ16496.1 hypothetical protein [Glutamicibacter soli]
MEQQRSNPSTAPSISLSASALAERQRFHGQSYGKAVQPVRTLFGCEPMAQIGPDAVFQDNEWCAALAASTPGQPLQAEGASPGRTPAAATAGPRLLAAALEAVKVRRIASNDRYVLHRAYPSPRGMFGVDVEASTGEGTVRIEPWGPYATLLGTPAAADGHGLPVLRLRTRPGRFPAPYGTLRPSLALLEAGHLLATIGAAAFQVGLAPAVQFGCAPDEPPCADSGELAGSVRHCQDGLRKLSTSGPHAAAVIGPADHAVLVRLASGRKGNTMNAPGDVEQWFHRRSSGSSHANLVTSAPIPTAVEAQLDAVVAAGLAAVARLLPDPTALVVHRIKLEENNMAFKSATRITHGPATGAQFVLDDSSEVPFSSALGYCWSVDFPAWERRYGSGTSAVLHSVLGWLCQWVCLAAAANMATARPARNFDEAAWGCALRLRPTQVPSYQVWLRPVAREEQRSGSWSTYGRKAWS